MLEGNHFHCMIGLTLASWAVALVCVLAGRQIAGSRLFAVAAPGAGGLLLCFWPGLAAVCGVLCLWATILPLKYALWLFAAYVVLRFKDVKAVITECSGFRWPPVLLFLFVQIVLAAKMAELTDNFDSYLYHYQLIDWYGQYGAVRGLPLVHFRLGFNSAWYALAAVFEFAPLAGRMGHLPNFLVLSAGAAHVLVLLLKRESWKTADYFWTYFFLSLVALVPIEVHSTSADLGTAILTGAAVWLFLNALRPAGGEGMGTAGLALLTASGAASVKLSALAGVAVIAIGALTTVAGARRRALMHAIALFPLAAHTVMSFTTSGCLLTFASRSCLDVPWALSRWDMDNIAESTRSFYMWSNISPATDFQGWFEHWFPHERTFAALTAGTAAAIIALALLRRRRPEALQWREIAWVSAAAMAGIALCFHSAPATRFAAGYLLLVPTLACAAYGLAGAPFFGILVSVLQYLVAFTHAPLPRTIPTQRSLLIALFATAVWFAMSRTREESRRKAMFAMLIAAVSFAAVYGVYVRPIKINPADHVARWLLPARAFQVEQGELEKVQEDGFTLNVTKPPNTNCAYGNLPCSLYGNSLGLLSRERGIGGGFQKRPVTARVQ